MTKCSCILVGLFCFGNFRDNFFTSRDKGYSGNLIEGIFSNLLKGIWDRDTFLFTSRDIGYWYPLYKPHELRNINSILDPCGHTHASFSRNAIVVALLICYTLVSYQALFRLSVYKKNPAVYLSNVNCTMYNKFSNCFCMSEPIHIRSRDSFAVMKIIAPII